MIQSRISQLNEKIYHHYYLVNFFEFRCNQNRMFQSVFRLSMKWVDMRTTKSINAYTIQ